MSYNNNKPCKKCVVKEIIEKEQTFSRWQGWFPCGLWNNQAQIYQDKIYLVLSAYPIEFPEGRLIVEIVDDRTESQVISELSSDLKGAKSIERIAKYAIESLKTIGYVRIIFYLLTEDEQDIKFVTSLLPKEMSALSEERLRVIGRNMLPVWKQQKENIEVIQWQGNGTDQKPLFIDMHFEKGSWAIYCLISENLKNKKRRIYAVMVADKYNDKRQIGEKDKSVIETFSNLLIAAINNLRISQAKEIELRRINEYFNTLREFLKQLPEVNQDVRIYETLIEYCAKIIPQASLCTYIYDRRKNNLIHSVCFDPGNNVFPQEINIAGEDIDIAFSKQKIGLDKQTYDNLQIKMITELDSEYICIKSCSFANRSFLVIPVAFQETQYGLLVIIRPSYLLFDELEIETIRTIANAGAIDLYNVTASLTIGDVLEQWKSLGILHKYVGEDNSFDDLINRCLSFITAREGLGYNRAVYLVYEDETFSFYRAIGSVTLEDFISVKEKIKNEGYDFECLMQNAPEIKDVKLKTALTDFIIKKDQGLLWQYLQNEDPIVIDLSMNPRLRDDPSIRDISSRLKTQYFIIIKIPGKESASGCIIVDRCFDNHTFDNRDLHYLRTFVVEMARIFEAFYSRQTILQTNYSSTLGWMASAIGHELNQPALALHSAATLLQKHFVENNYKEAVVDIYEIIENKQRIQDTINSIGGFIDFTKREVISPELLIKGSCILFEKKFIKNNINLRIYVESDLPEMELYSTILKIAIVNLVRNAFEAFQPDTKQKEIEIACDKSGDLLIIQVKDNAGGIPSEVLKKIQKPGSIFSTKIKKGWGVGLNIVRKAVELNNGTFEIKNRTIIKGAKAILKISMISDKNGGSDGK